MLFSLGTMMESVMLISLYVSASLYVLIILIMDKGLHLVWTCIYQVLKVYTVCITEFCVSSQQLSSEYTSHV